MTEETIVAIEAERDKVVAVSRLRSTLLTSSLKSLQDRGLLERYFQHLPAKDHSAIRSCVAGVWLPIELGLAHYTACDALGLSTDEQLSIGREVGLKIQGTVLGTLLKLATGAGVTPWTCLGQYQRLWDRLMTGGGVSVTKVGPKEARLEFVSFPLARIPYFRTAFRGVNVSACELFCRKAYTDEIKRLCSSSAIGYRVSWA